MVEIMKDVEASVKDFGLVCVVLNTHGEVLLLHRSDDKKLFPGLWHVVGAFPFGRDKDVGEVVEYATKKEIGSVPEVKKFGSVHITNRDGIPVGLVPVLAVLKDGQGIVINEEHTEYFFVSPQDLGRYNMIPGTEEIIRGLLISKNE